jgi:hypothetical protein
VSVGAGWGAAIRMDSAVLWEAGRTIHPLKMKQTKKLTNKFCQCPQVWELTLSILFTMLFTSTYKVFEILGNFYGQNVLLILFQ